MKKIINKFAIIFITVLFMFTSVACGNASVNNDNLENKNTEASAVSSSKYPLTIKDSRGKEVTIDKEVKRIVSVAPTVTEIIYGLGKGNELVGRTDYCDYPSEVKNVESIGNITDPSVEKIVELKPDIVFVSMVKEDIVKKLEDLGIKVFAVYDADNLDDAYTSIVTIGKLIGAEEKAQEIVGTMKNKIKDINEKVKMEKAPSVYYVIGFGKDGDYAATGDTFIGKLIDMAGGDNIAKGTARWKYSLEKLIENDPEYIILPKNYGMKDEFIKTDGYKELSAVKNNKVIEIDDNLLSRQGPRLAEGVEELARILHPDLFK